MGVANIFTEGFGLLAATLDPAIPASALGSKLLIADQTNIQSRNNDLPTAWNILREKLTASKHKLLPYKHYAQVAASSINALIPPSLDDNQQVAFLEFLCSSLTPIHSATPFVIDHSKFEAAARFSHWLISSGLYTSSKRAPTFYGKTLEVYLSITGEASEFGKRMSFAPVNFPSDKSLAELMDSILRSLRWTSNHTYLGIQGVDILNQIKNEFTSLALIIYGSQSTGVNLPIADVNEILKRAKRVKIENGEDYELKIDDTSLISANGDVIAQSPFSVCRFGSFSILLEPLRPEHAGALRKALVYLAQSTDRTILFLADDIIRATYEVIRKRSDTLFGADQHSVPPEILECIDDRSWISKELRANSCFNRAANVIQCNHYTSSHILDVSDSERALLRWLEQFESPEASILLEVIAAHQCITKDHVIAFANNVSQFKDGAIVFSTKSPTDHGGVHRLFTLTQEGQEVIRSLALDDAVFKIAEYKGSDMKLVILAEIIMSGSQLEKNFKWHYFSEDKPNEPYIKTQRLFEIENIKHEFLRGLKCFTQIVILAAAYTQRGFVKLRECLSSGLGIPPESIEIKGSALNDTACFFEESEDISQASKSALKRLLSDVDRLKAIFDFADEQDYVHTLKDLDNANLIVRPNSVTKKGLRIFTLTPRNKNIPPLFRITSEHE